MFLRIPAPSVQPLQELLIDKGYQCWGYSPTHRYFAIHETVRNKDSYTFHSFGEIGGKYYYQFHRKHLAPLALLPKEAVLPYLYASLEKIGDK